ncbi:MAG: methylenetetrahydrofolate reductase [Desulfobacterales bacterium]|nr:methylenetetrahydrofolate reductase [Desulfobacterales bacterium]
MRNQFRRYLIARTQINGSFYSWRGFEDGREGRVRPRPPHPGRACPEPAASAIIPARPARPWVWPGTTRPPGYWNETILGTATATHSVSSLELFPPKDDDARLKLHDTVRELAALDPEYFSVTFGAGGSTRDRTLETVLRDPGARAWRPRRTCPASARPRENIRDILQRYRDAGIRRIVALRGDLPSGMADAGEFRYANELVAFIREETGDWFHIEVAAYPEVPPAGAQPAGRSRATSSARSTPAPTAAITQYFYNADAYCATSSSECAALGVTVPIVPGIMPIANFSSSRASPMPAAPRSRAGSASKLESFGDDTAVDPRLRAGRRHRRCATACSPAARRACTSTP